MKKLLLACLCGLICSLPGMAQKARPVQQAGISQAPPPVEEQLIESKMDAATAFDSSAAPNDALTAAIRKMLEETGAVEIALQTIDKTMEQQQAANPAPEMAAFFDRFAKVCHTKRVRNLFMNLYVKIYRKHFTLEEVEALNHFYQTPVGRKSLTVLGPIMTESGAEGGKLGELLAQEILQQMELENK